MAAAWWCCVMNVLMIMRIATIVTLYAVIAYVIASNAHWLVR